MHEVLAHMGLYLDCWAGRGGSHCAKSSSSFAKRHKERQDFMTVLQQSFSLRLAPSQILCACTHWTKTTCPTNIALVYHQVSKYEIRGRARLYQWAKGCHPEQMQKNIGLEPIVECPLRSNESTASPKTWFVVFSFPQRKWNILFPLLLSHKWQGHQKSNWDHEHHELKEWVVMKRV